MWRISPPSFGWGGGESQQKSFSADEKESQESQSDLSVCKEEHQTSETSRVEEGSSLVVRSNLQLVVAQVFHSPPMRNFRDLLSRPAVLSFQSPLWLLGVLYESPPGDSNADLEVSTRFQRDFESRLWFTYRRDFEAMGEAKLSSDVGWGCMLRSGQMLLAQALLNDRLGRSWRWDSEVSGAEYLDILTSFGDAPGSDHPFSIHNLINAGLKHGLCAGAWVGPYVLCRTLESLANADCFSSTSLRMGVHVVAGDQKREGGGAPILFIDDVVKLCLEDGPGSEDGPRAMDGVDERWRSILILVPLMLGHDKVNPRYLPSLRAIFEFPQSLGVLGGKPGGATYLVGIQDGQLLYLDPHQVQQTVLLSSDKPDVDTSSYHCRVPRKMPLEAMDPSLALGFYCKTQEDLEDFCERASELAKVSKGAPMFTVGRREDSPFTEVSESSSPRYSDQAPKEMAHEEEEWQLV